MPNFAALLCTALAHAGLSQRELARRTGLMQHHVNALCGGKKDPRLSTVLLICEHVSIDLNSLKKGYTPVN